MIIYTFRTFPSLEQLPDNVFVFSKLKEDLEALKHRLTEERPEYLVGIAVSKGASRIEPLAINRFNNGKVSQKGEDQLGLFVPTNRPFALSAHPTFSFCNWTMYKLQEFISNSNIETKLIFFHVNPSDINDLIQYLAYKRNTNQLVNPAG